MNRLQSSRIISVGLVILAISFVLAQFSFPGISSGGGWCSPYLDAPKELGHPAYEFVSYGFPFPFVTVAKENCFSLQSTTHEWFIPGIVVDGSLLGIIVLLWFQRRRKPVELLQIK